MVAVSVGAWALRLAVVAAVVSIAGVRRPRVGVAALVAAVGGMALAVAVLGEAFWSKDFTLAYVADHARRDADAATRLSGIWGGMAGSLLFFGFGTAVASLVAAWRSPAALRGTVAAVGGAVTAALGGVVVLLSDPFDRLEIPAVDGAGLTPILEHSAMLYHPPLVYAGLTALTATFALTVAALAHGPLEAGWVAQARQWLLVPWTLLAVGMLAGAHWAYVELGWGGYWAWDPVENTALLPWLAVTAALHRLQASVSNRRRIDTDGVESNRAAAGLVGAAFLLALLGGLLTRSGATMSVHAFAEERTIGRALGAVLLAASLGFVALVARHRRHHPGVAAPAPVWPPTRVGALRVQQILVGAALLVVLIGSVWPLTADLRDAQPVSVDGSFFAAFCGPLAVALLVVMAVGPALGRGSAGSVTLPPALGAAAGLGAAAFAGWDGLFALAAAAAGGAAVAGTATGAVRARGTGRPLGSHVAHLGVAVFLLGVAGTTTGATETVSLARDQTTEIHGLPVTNLGAGVVPTASEDTEAVQAEVEVDGQRHQPQLVAHTTRGRLLAESSLQSTWRRDVQVMLRDARDDGSVVLQVGIHPLQQLVWWGALLIVAGGAAALIGPPTVSPPGPDRPRAGAAASRAGTPATRPAAGPPPAPPPGARDASAPSARA